MYSSAIQPATVPSLLVEHSGKQRTVVIDRSPFTIGRRSDNDLVIADPHVSREQARIVTEHDGYFLEDRGSSFGTFVNGERIAWRRLEIDDRIAFGGTAAVSLTFSPTRSRSGRSDILNALALEPQGEALELERLAMCLEAARKLNTTGVSDEILATLLEATLRLTGAERGFVFLRDKDGTLRLANGRDARGNELLDESTISHTILDRAINAGTEFVIGDTSEDDEIAMQHSIIAHDLRAVICMPLLGAQRNVTGALYLDSHFAGRSLTGVSHDLLRSIAAQAATLVQNAQLAEAEQAARRYEQELAISKEIQQGLMNVNIPVVPFASIRGRSMACKEIGGDFFDVVYDGNTLAVVVADVSGKAVSAALLASILQGLIYAELMSNIPLDRIATAANSFLCCKDLHGKYATLTIMRLYPDGMLELINCGHVPPCLIHDGKLERIREGNMPVGMFTTAKFESVQLRLAPGDRLVLVTDGVTEAQDTAEDFFGDERLEMAALSPGLTTLFAAIDKFRGSRILDDDCTAVELIYSGMSSQQT